MKIADFISRHMALGVLLGAVVALSFPTPVSACFKTACIPWFLGAVMFGMGLTLRGRDFALVLSRPIPSPPCPAPSSASGTTCPDPSLPAFAGNSTSETRKKTDGPAHGFFPPTFLSRP